MKIVLVGQRFNAHDPLVTVGGTEQVEKTHLALLSDHDVTFITSQDSKDCKLPHVKTVKVSMGCKFGSLEPWKPRDRLEEVKKIIQGEKPDLVIVHDDNNNGLNKWLSSQTIPSMVFVHSHLGIAGGISAFGYIESLYHLSKEGQTVVSVSNASRREWHSLIKKSGHILKNVPKNFIEDEFSIFNSVLHQPVIFEKPILSPTVNRTYTTIGRMIEIKKHHISLISDVSPNKINLFTPPCKNEDEKQYFEKVKLAKGYDENNHFVDISHRAIMESLSRSCALLSCAQESFGLTAIEANMYGVPVILHHPIEDHPIMEATSPSHQFGSCHRVPWSRDHADYVNFLKNFQPLSVEQREGILEKTWDYYGLPRAKQRFNDLIQECIERKTKHTRDSNSIDL